MKTIKSVFTVIILAIIFFLAGKVNAQTDSTALNQLHKNKNGNSGTNNANPNPKLSKMQVTNGKQGILLPPSNRDNTPVDTTSTTPVIIMSNKKN